MGFRASEATLYGEGDTAIDLAADPSFRRALDRYARLAALGLRTPEAHLILGPPENPLLTRSYGKSPARLRSDLVIPPSEALTRPPRESGQATRELVATIKGPEGVEYGSLWVVDREPRRWSKRERLLLDELGAAAGEDIRGHQLVAGRHPSHSAAGDTAFREALSTDVLFREGISDPLVANLRSGILSAVHEGLAEAGTRLPSIREVAENVGATRYSVLQAYRTLEGEGIVEKRHRSGVFVAALGESSPPHLPETARWIGRVITDSYLHQIKLPALPGLIKRWTASTTIRCACAESSEDYRAALGDEVRLHFGLEPVSVPLPSPSDNGSAEPPGAECERLLSSAHLVITTPFHAPEVGRIADRLGIPIIVATLDEDCSTVAARRISLGRDLVVICVDPAFGERVLMSVPRHRRSRVRLVTADAADVLETLDRDEPVLMTGAAKSRLAGSDFRLLAAHYPSFSRRFAERLAPVILQINLQDLRSGTVAPPRRT